jgi:hypothetical protein
MELAAQAFHADIHGEDKTARSLFRKAFDLERQAALLLADDTDAEPTRAILFRSAATLGIDCHDFREAERLVAMGLAGNPPTELGEELRDALEKVYFSRHLSLRGLELDPGEFQMSLAGDAVGFGMIESLQFLRRAEIAEKLLIRTVERLRDIPFRETGSPKKDTLEGFEVYFSTPRAASFALTIRLGRPHGEHQGLLPGFVRPKDVVDEVLACLIYFDRDDVDGLRERIRSEAYLNNFTALSKKLAPDGRRVKTVGFTSIRGQESQNVVLSHPVGEVWRRGLDEERSVELLGTIRSADETSKRGGKPVFGVEDDNGKTHTITVPPGLLQDIVKPYWGERVRVLAVRIGKGRFRLLEIEPFEQG